MGARASERAQTKPLTIVPHRSTAAHAYGVLATRCFVQADLHAKTAQGQTPLALAQHREREASVAMLQARCTPTPAIP